jgi:hypothetical protein
MDECSTGEKCSNTATHLPSSAPMIHTDENVESYASLQCDVADSLKRVHKLKLPVTPRRQQSQFRGSHDLYAVAPPFLQEGDGTAYASLQCDTFDDPKYQR